MGQKSLNEMMNELAQGRNTVRRNHAPFKPNQTSPEEALSELDAFAQLDDLLESLQKQYLDAKAQRAELTAVWCR